MAQLDGVGAIGHGEEDVDVARVPWWGLELNMAEVVVESVGAGRRTPCVQDCVGEAKVAPLGDFGDPRARACMH